LQPCLGSLPLEILASEEVYHTKEEYDHKKSSSLAKDDEYVEESSMIQEDNSGHCGRVPQMSDSIKTEKAMSFMTNFLQGSGIYGLNGVLDDTIVRHIEGLIICFYGVQSADNIHSVIASILAYSRDHFKGSILKTLTDVVNDTFKEDLTNETTEAEGREAQIGRPDWLVQLGNLKDGWKMFRENNAYRRICKLLNALVAAGLCDAADLAFTIKGFDIFNEEMLRRDMSTMDILDAIMNACTFFIEGAYMCFATKSIKPLLMNDCDAATLDKDYNEVAQMWLLVQNGNLELQTSFTEEGFLQKLEYVTKRFQDMSHSLTGFDRKIVQDRIRSLLIIHNDYNTMLLSGGVRISPFTIGFFGDSAQGKTTIGDLCIDALLTSMGLSLDRKYRSVIRPEDKFWNTWKTSTTVAMLDDFGNGNPNKTDINPIDILLMLCNNQVCFAPKAEIEGKGRNLVRPYLVLVNGHLMHLNAHAWSVAPYSGQRRVHFSMKVVAKKQFQAVDSMGRPIGLDADKVREFYTVDGVFSKPPIEDLWDITVYRAIRPDDLANQATYELVVWNNRVMKDISVSVLIQFLLEMNAKHQKNQKTMVENQKDREHQFEKCPHTITVSGKEAPCCQVVGNCPYHDNVPTLGNLPADLGQVSNHSLISPRAVENRHLTKDIEVQWGKVIATALISMRDSYKPRIVQEIENFWLNLERKGTRSLLDFVENLPKKVDPIPFLPSCMVKSKLAIKFIKWYYQEEVEKRIRQMRYAMYGLYALYCIFALMVFNKFFALLAMGVMWNALANHTQLEVDYIQHKMLVKVHERHDLASATVKKYRECVTENCCKMFLGLAALYAVIKIYRTTRNMLHTEPQGNLEPKNDADLAMRDSETNVWAQVEKRPLPICEAHKTITMDQLNSKIDKNLFYAEAHMKDGNYMVDVLAVQSNVVLIPDHYFAHQDEFRITLFKDKHKKCGGRFKTIVSKEYSVRINGSDMRLCYTPNGGSFEDISDYFPSGYEFDPVLFDMHYRDNEGKIIVSKGKGQPGLFSNGHCESQGVKYENLSINTFKGLCGAVLIADARFPFIVGIHVGGETDKPRGNAVTISKEDYKFALSQVRKLPGVLVTGSATAFRKVQMGINIMKDEPLHYKSPLNYIAEGKNAITYYGSCLGASTTKPQVKQSKISRTVTKICGVENIWGAPKLNPTWFGWQKALNSISEPADPYPPSLLKKAILDYKRPLLEIIAKSNEWKKCRPLTDIQNVNGIPGVKFMDAIKLNTSMGIPWTGTKEPYVEVGDPTVDYPEGIRYFNDEVMGEINLIENLYREGRRGNCIVKACKKQEVLDVSKGKCRIFYVSSVVLTYLVRKYFLWPIRFLCMNSLIAECAVGINCHSEEWEQLMNHVRKFGNHKVFAGDYGSYDQKLPSQLIIAAIGVAIDIARAMGYDEESLNVMEAMAGDIAFPFIAYNGDLISLDSGTHVSGNSLTVIVNGIAGALNLRCFYFDKYPRCNDFRQYVAMMEYGDDNDGSVSFWRSKFNVRDFSEWIGQFGQKYTHPDKESDIPKYMHSDDVDFLKRRSVFHPELGVRLGALDHKSMWKQLHAYVYTSSSPGENELCINAIDSFLRESFNHGREIYETHRSQMQEVAEIHNYTTNCTMLSKTFDDMIEEWKEKYRSGDADS
jgi:hypothetical protein